MTVVFSSDDPDSVCSRYAIELYGGVFVLLLFFFFRIPVGYSVGKMSKDGKVC